MGTLAYLGAADVVSTVAEEQPAYHPGSPRLLDRVRTAMRTRHMSGRSGEAYVFWIRRYIRFHDRRHPATLGVDEVTRFLSSLAEKRRVSASTQNQALSALRFLYRHVLGVDLPWLTGLVHARRPAHVPVVLGREEVAAVLSRLGHRDVRTTMIYTHVLNRGGLGVVSPVDGLIGPAGAVAPGREPGRVPRRPIAWDESPMRLGHRRENEDLPEFAGAAATRNRLRDSRGERD